MQYRRFGKTGLNLSVLSLGGMRYPHGWDKPREVIPDDTFEVGLATTRRAVEVGINHIETARGYGKSEDLYGKIIPLLPVPRESLIITTKIGPMETYKEMREAVDDSLRRLGISYLDNFDLHGINLQKHLDTVLKKGGCLKAVQDCVKEGLIRHVGFSTHAPLEVILRTIETGEFESVNLHFYYFFQRNLAAIKLARAKDMGVFIISPNDKGGQLFNPPEKLTKLTHPLHPMIFNARFCLSFPEISTLSLGAAKPEEIDPILAALETDRYLTAGDRAVQVKLDAQVTEVGSDYCTGCAECLPCPELINIPEVLRFRNMDVAYGMRGFGQYRYNMFKPDDHWFMGHFGDKCTDCGDCLPRCPVKLEIPRLVRDTHARLFVEKKK